MNGERFYIRHPELVVPRNELAIFTEADRTSQLFDAASVARLTSVIVSEGKH